VSFAWLGLGQRVCNCWLAWMVVDGIGSMDSRSMGSGRAVSRVCILKLLHDEGCCGRSEAGMEGAKSWHAPDMSHGNDSHCKGVVVLTKPWPAWSLSPRVTDVDPPTFLAQTWVGL
jgi:hypothetical protein